MPEYFESQPEETNLKKLEEIKNKLFNREVPQEYQELIEGARFIELQEPYAESLQIKFYKDYFSETDKKKELSDFGKLISSQMKGNVVLDLGCGKTSYMSSFSEDCEDEMYIGVDLNPDVFIPIVTEKQTVGMPSYLKSEYSTKGTVVNNHIEDETEPPRVLPELKYEISEYSDRVMQIRDDMLRAVSRMTSESVGFVIISGIEVPSGEKQEITGRYCEALENEITRVLKPDGIVLRYDGLRGISDINFSDKDFSLIEYESRGATLYQKTAK